MNLAVNLDREEYNMAAPASCMGAEHGCVMFDCLVHLWEWIDPPVTQTQFQMENKKNVTATQQPLTQQHLMAHHVHPDQIYSPQHSQIPAHLNNQTQQQIQPNGVMHQLLQSQYHSNMNARSPLLENRHEIYGTGHNHDYARHYGANDNYNYPQSPPRFERPEIHIDHNVNHELMHNIPKGYNAEVYQDYLKRNPPKDNQIYQNHQPTYRPNINQYSSKPYLPYSNRIGPQSNTELLRRQYNEIQQMKMQQQMHYQNQAQMHQQQKFAERQILLQQIHGVQPPANLQNSIYSDSSYRDLYSSKSDFKEFSSPDLQKDIDMYAKNNEYRDRDVQNRPFQDQWQVSPDYREADRQKQEQEKVKSPDFNNQKPHPGIVSPMKSSESSTSSIKSPSSESRRSSGTQALRSPTAYRIPSAPVTISGLLYKQGSDGLKVWRKRWFVLSEYCLFYYKSQDEQKLLGSVLLPSYKVSACSTEDKVMRKYAFKLEHVNMRTYVLAALDQDAMMKWVKALTMAALMQNPNEQQKQNDRTAAKTDDGEDAGPTYANAPPKPRRANDGYNSPSPDMYDPNYDLLKKPASHYSQSTRYQDTYKENYSRSPQSPIYQTKRYDTQNLTLPLNNENIEKPTNLYKSNPHLSSPYFSNRSRNEQPDDKIESLHDKQSNYNPFQDYSEKLNDRPTAEANKMYNESYPETRTNAKTYDANKHKTSLNERLVERRTPEAYSRSTATSAYNPEKIGDYEDIYAAYNDKYMKSPSTSQSKDTVSLSSHKSPQDQTPTSYPQEKTFSGPSVLRRKKMQASGIQPPMPRPHSADFLEYESKNEINKTLSTQTYETKQPKRPKSSLDINSYYDPSSDKYYSEESYAQKMRQSAQYLQQQGLGPRNIQIPLEKYASGLAEKQLHSPYPQTINNNYETEFSGSRNVRDNISRNSKYSDVEGMNSNWTLKEKEENMKEFLNRSGSVMSDSSNVSAFVKEKYDPTEGFMRSASARLPATERDGEKKVQQREESMKRLLEWKQRMLQSPLTRKSTPAAISLARSLNQSRQSLRSDQYKSKTYKNASYNSYSSDDEEETPDTDLQNTRMQAGRSHNDKLSNALTKLTPHTLNSISITDQTLIQPTIPSLSENTYENILCTVSLPKLINDIVDDSDIIYGKIKRPEPLPSTSNTLENQICLASESVLSDHEGYETHDSEAESETHIEYTDNDLDEVLLESDNEVESNTDFNDFKCDKDKEVAVVKKSEENSITPPVVATMSEDHYLPMSPRKISTVEPDHKTLLEIISVFDQSMPLHYEDNPYVEMNLGNDEDDTQTYEIVCINDEKPEPVYMELSNVISQKQSNEELTKSSSTLDTASNFADTKDQTLKRSSKNEKVIKEKLESDFEDVNKELSLDVPFSRFSISDTFRPASYYLSGSSTVLERQDSSDNEVLSPPPVPSTSPPFDNLLDEELSKYILDKLDKSDISQDNSIIKMLTSENQNMNKMKKRTTSLMIYGSRTSIHDTLSRGEKVRISRASLTNERKKSNETSSNFLNTCLTDQRNSSGVDSDSVRSYNADKGSSRLSLESDVSSKFEMAPSNISEVTSLLDSDSLIDLRHPYEAQNIENLIRRRPLSDDSIFEVSESENRTLSEGCPNIILDSYLYSLEETTNIEHKNKDMKSHRATTNSTIRYRNKEPNNDSLIITHTRSSSTPVSQSFAGTSDEERSGLRNQSKCNNDKSFEYLGSQSSCSSGGLPTSPISFYRKDYSGDTMIRKNLNNDILSDKVKDFDSEKLALKHGNETAGSSTTTGFHSRESSTEHSAPYYYSDLSSQEHINVLPISHYLKNTNIHRKLNNQRRRGPINKKNEISHIHNPIRNNQVLMSEQSFDLAASARSVSVEFLSVVEKNPDIDLKNIYESTSSKTSKIPESMKLISSLTCKKSTKNRNYDQMSSPDVSILNENSIQINSSIKVSSGSMSSYCSENSSNTVYYDAETEASAYENVNYHGEKHWDEDVLWRDNLRRVSHRHARSMDDLDTMPVENSVLDRTYPHSSTINSIKRIKKPIAGKLNKSATYVNCDIQSKVQRQTDDSRIENNSLKIEKNENDIYVSLAEDSEVAFEQPDEGVYEQLAISSSENSLAPVELANFTDRKCRKNRRQFEIDRENLRQWDLMSSGLMKGEVGRVRSAVISVGMSEPICSKDNGTDRSNEASMTMSGTHLEPGQINNNNHQIQQALSKKAFLGSNTSIGRSNRDGNIPVRAVSPRVRWVEEKPVNDHYGSQQITASQQNLNAATEEVWTTVRSPSRSQQPIKAVSPRVRRNNENDDIQKAIHNPEFAEVPTAGELLGRSHEELVLLLIQLRRRHAANHRSIETCCAQINSIEDCLSSLKALEREESLQRLEQLKMQLMELESQYEKSKPLVQLVDNMVKLGSLYNRPGSTIERLERNQRLRQKVLAEHAMEQQRWIESAAAGKQLETEAARVRVAELWALEQELADEAAILQGLKTDKDAIDSLLTGVRSKLDSVNITPRSQTTNTGLEAELARVHAMLAHNSKKLEQTVADNARLERELHHLRRALRAQRANTHTHAQTQAAHPTALLEDEVSRVQHLVSALQRQRQELSRAVRHLTQQSHVLQTTHDSIPGKRRPTSCWQETNLDTGHTIDHGNSDYYDVETIHPPGHYGQSMETPLYVDTRSMDVTPINSEDMQNSGFANLSNVEKQEIKTVRIVKRESERRQRDRERSLQPMSDWSSNITANLDQFLEEELVQPIHNYRASSLPRTDYKYEDYYTTDYHRQDKMDSPKYPSSPSLSYDYSQNMSSLSSSYNKNMNTNKKDRSLSTQYVNSPTDSSRTLTNMSKTSSIMSLTRSNMELSPIFKSEAAKQIVTEMNDNGSMHRRQVPREKRRHYTAPHHLSAKTLNEMPKDGYNQDALGRSLDDADMELALRGAAPDVVRSALPSRKIPDSIDQLLAAPQKIIIPERYIPEKPPELSPEEQQKRQEKVESIKKMLTSSSADPTKSPDCEEKKQREHLLQMNQILAKQVTEMSKIIAVKALEELPLQDNMDDYEDRSPDVELPIYQQRDNFFT